MNCEDLVTYFYKQISKIFIKCIIHHVLLKKNVCCQNFKKFKLLSLYPNIKSCKYVESIPWGTVYIWMMFQQVMSGNWNTQKIVKKIEVWNTKSLEVTLKNKWVMGTAPCANIFMIILSLSRKLFWLQKIVVKADMVKFSKYWE